MIICLFINCLLVVLIIPFLLLSTEFLISMSCHPLNVIIEVKSGVPILCKIFLVYIFLFLREWKKWNFLKRHQLKAMRKTLDIFPSKIKELLAVAKFTTFSYERLKYSPPYDMIHSTYRLQIIQTQTGLCPISFISIKFVQ